MAWFILGVVAYVAIGWLATTIAMVCMDESDRRSTTNGELIMTTLLWWLVLIVMGVIAFMDWWTAKPRYGKCFRRLYGIKD